MNRPKTGDTIVVWFSCGAASAVAARMTVDKYPFCNVRIVNNPIAEEDEDNRRFLKDVERWLDLPIESAINADFPDSSCNTVWKQRKYMAGPQGAPCTMKLKKGARQQWENRNHFDWIVLGFTSEERKRHDRFALTERDNVLPVLIDADVSKDDCYRIVRQAGIKLPKMYTMGYPNANCVGCVKATSPTYWNHVRKMHPEVFKERADLEKKLGANLVRYKGKRIQLHDLPADAKGRPMKSMDIECGIYCEERE